MDRIYGVSSGSYSDYRVHCVATSKKDAEAIAKKMQTEDGGWHTDAFVESFAVVSANIERVSILRLQENLWDDGTRSQFDERTSMEWPFDPTFDDCRPMVWRWVRAPFHANKGGRLEVSGLDHELVRKTFSGKRAQLEAEDAMRLKKEARGRA